MSNQQNPPRNQPDAVATNKGWRHPQTGELLVSVKGLPLREPVEEQPTDSKAGELEVVTSSLAGSQPLEVTVTIANAADLEGGHIHWGDGSPDLVPEMFDVAEHTHVYPNVGECTLKVTGTFKGGESDTVTKLVKITALGAKRGPKPKAKAEAQPEVK